MVVRRIMPPVIDPVNPDNSQPPRFLVNLPNDPQFFRPKSMPFMVRPWSKNASGANVPPPAPGNPGPQQRFNVRDYPWIVRHFSIIE
jgi:hypothetical protein